MEDSSDCFRLCLPVPIAHRHTPTPGNSLGLLFPIIKPKGSDLTVMWWNVYGFEAHSTLALVTANA